MSSVTDPSTGKGMPVGFLKNGRPLEKDELEDARTVRKPRTGYAKETVEEFLTLPKQDQKSGIEIPVANFCTTEKTRTVESVVVALNAYAIKTEATVVARRSPNRPATHIALFTGKHEPKPRSSKGDSDQA